MHYKDELNLLNILLRSVKLFPDSQYSISMLFSQELANISKLSEND